MENTCSGQKGLSPPPLPQPSQLERASIWEKNLTTSVARANSTRTCLDCVKQHVRMLWLSRLNQVTKLTRLGAISTPCGALGSRMRAKVLIRRKDGPARIVTLPSQKGNLARRVRTLLAKPTFLFLMKTVPHLLWGNIGKVGSPRVARVGGWHFYFPPYKRSFSLVTTVVDWECLGQVKFRTLLASLQVFEIVLIWMSFRFLSSFTARYPHELRMSLACDTMQVPWSWLCL